MSASRAVRSISWRLRAHDQIRAGEAGGVFDEPFDYIPNSRCLMIRRLPSLKAGTTVSKVYSRAGTATYVNQLIPPEAKEGSVIAKIFCIEAPVRKADRLLAEHEIEVRMLLLLTALMREGVTDAATVPLALATVTEQELKASGLLVPGTKLFPPPKRLNGRQTRYAVIFAELADSSLTDVVWMACVTDRERFSSDYVVLAALLQICHVLASLHAIFPSFRHNDLHANNVLIQSIHPGEVREALGDLLPPGHPIVVEYELCGRRWQVDLEKAPFRCLLWDFSYASIEQRDGMHAGLDLLTPRESRFGSTVALDKTAPNQYCDIQKLCDTLRWVLQQGDRSGWTKGISEATRNLIEHVSPTGTSFADKALSADIKSQRQLQVHRELQHTSPTRLLLIDDFFDRLCINDTPKEARVRPVYTVSRRKHADSVKDICSWQGLQTPTKFST